MASSISLDDEILYPMFVRNAPSDVTLVDTIAAMVVRHSVTAVGILAIGDSYGIRASNMLVDKLEDQNVTIVMQKFYSPATRSFIINSSNSILSTNIDSLVCTPLLIQAQACFQSVYHNPHLFHLSDFNSSKVSTVQE